MSQLLDDLVDLLALEKIEENLFRGRSQDLGFKQLFGGQVLGQSLSAASQTVDTERHVHSVHGYFLRPGDPTHPIVYQVDPLRDGGSFTTRRVQAIQKGKPIFTMICSFQGDEQGYEHQVQMPDVPGPEDLPNETEWTRKYQHLIHEKVRDKVLCGKPIEIRPVGEFNPFEPKGSEPVRYMCIALTASYRMIRRCIVICWPMPRTSTCWARPCNHMPSLVGRPNYRLPAWTMRFGITVRCVWMIGCCTPWTAHRLAALVVCHAGISLIVPVSWLPQSRKSR